MLMDDLRVVAQIHTLRPEHESYMSKVSFRRRAHCHPSLSMRPGHQVTMN
jgi:hypothetical protein